MMEIITVKDVVKVVEETWWEAKTTMLTIRPVTVLRRSEKSLWIGGQRPRRELIKSLGVEFFPTREEAKGYIIEHYKNMVARAERRLENAKQSLAEASSL